MRPGDANEVVEAWKVIAQLKHDPVALVLTRQAIPTLDRTKYAAASGVAKGAYVLADAPDGKPDVILIGTGSEAFTLCGRLRTAHRRRRQSPCRQHAFVGASSSSRTTPTRQRPAARCESPRLRRGRHRVSAGRSTLASTASLSA